jgi:3-isopropylmalate dehydrogenase
MVARFEIAVIPGDGIGPAVTESATKVLGLLAEIFGFCMQFVTAQAGDRAEKELGKPLPESSYEKIVSSHACLKGPVGETARHVVIPLRQKLDLYANLRPSRSLPRLSKAGKSVDLVIVRENTEDLYRGIEDRAEDYAFTVRVVTRRSSERIAKVACDLAESRRKKLTIVHKANVMRSCELFRDSVRAVARGYPSLEVDEMYVDNAAYQLVRDPGIFDVIVTTNMFGDILSDEAAGVAGSLGTAPSANIGDRYGLFEPVHGSAPTLSEGMANPIAAILSAGMMLQWLSEKYSEPKLEKASRLLQGATQRLLEEGRVLTPDMGGASSTAEVTDQLITNVKFLAETWKS